jgi:hypothetical protein
MQISPYPLCCGAYIITGFQYFYKETDEKAKAFNDNIRKKDGDWLKNTVDNYNRYAILQAIISEKQEFGNHELLLAAGFQPVAQGINGIHDSRNTLYVWAREKSAKKTVEKPVKAITKIVKTKFTGLPA